ncbi:MAG: NAD-dependent epimerase/dehydratase family protein [Planctomycetes bacterium]|nr:NAD-dependent epimerase/dehydratase family protein [Planctomycetota bacterium]
MAKILVTGGAGFIGSHVVNILINEGHPVRSLDDLSGGFRENVNPKAEFIEASITDKDAVDEAVKGVEIIYHLAAYAAEGLSHFIKRFNYENNLMGSVNLINAAVNNDVKVFLFTSSMAVYGMNVTPMEESLTPRPEDSYGIAKYAVEKELEISKELFGLDYVIIRPHNVYGEGQNIGDKYRNVIGIFMNQIMQGKPPTIFGDGEQTRAFSYIGDVAPCIARAPFTPEALGEIINVGAAKHYTINQLAEEVVKAMETDIKPVHLEARFEVKHAFCTTKKSEDLLGYKTSVTLEEGVRRMAEWARKKGPQPQKKWDNYEIMKNIPSFWLE